MKKLITLALIVGATTLTQAQSNLVFNRVLNFSLQSQEVVTVPEGKVWKMEWGIMSGGIQIISTNQPYGTDLTTVNSNSFAVQSKDEPIWLGEGSSIVRSSSTAANMLSVLEFNVVPTSSSTGDSGGGVSADGFTASGIINLEFSGTNSSGNIGTKTVLGTITVPEGKIWKIISSSFGNSSNPDTVYLGNGYNGDIFVDDFIVSGEDRPVYLTAGSYEVAGKTAASGGGGIYYIFGKIGGIEYNDN